MKWKIWKHGPGEWRAGTRAGFAAKCSSHAETVAFMQQVVSANRYPPLAA